MVEAIQCLYLRAAIEQFTHSKNTTARYSNICLNFPGLQENVTKERFDVLAFRLLKVIRRRWKDAGKHAEFLEKFSIDTWKKLPCGERAKHTFGTCNGCSHFLLWHDQFPSRSTRKKPLLRVARQICRKTTHQQHEPGIVLQELNKAWNSSHGETIEEALLKSPQCYLQSKPSPEDRRQAKRALAKVVKEEMEEQWRKTAVNSFLSERQTFASFARRKRYESFESKEDMLTRYQSTPKKTRSHSPSQHHFNEQAVVAAAGCWPKDKKINWTKFAADHGIAGNNRGQVVKDFLRGQGVDVLALEHQESKRTQMRPRRLRFSCGVSQPAKPTTSFIREGIKSAIKEGKFNLGEKCTGTILCTHKLENGQVVNKEIHVHGQKIPLIDVRRRLLKRHEAAGLMREHVLSLEEYASLPREELILQLTELGEHETAHDGKEDFELSTQLYIYHHTRLLFLGHDHADLLGHNYLMEVVQVVYDKALFLTDNEYKCKTGRGVDVQSLVEIPEIRLLSMSGASEEEQLRVVPGRAQDLHTVQAELSRQKGEGLVDQLVGFLGDHQARWFEAGLQKGGGYSCGSGCGCRSTDYPNYASNLQRIPSYCELRERATAGQFGKVAGSNLHHLSADEVRTELRKRGVKGTANMDGSAARACLRSILQGVLRVPALLAF